MGSQAVTHGLPQKENLTMTDFIFAVLGVILILALLGFGSDVGTNASAGAIAFVVATVLFVLATLGRLIVGALPRR